jgi:hypothetical protein
VGDGQDEAGGLDQMVAIAYLVVEFPHRRTTGEGLPFLVDPAARAIVRVVDLAFLRKEPDGTASCVGVADLGAPEREVLDGLVGGACGRGAGRGRGGALPAHAPGDRPVLVPNNCIAGGGTLGRLSHQAGRLEALGDGARALRRGGAPLRATPRAAYPNPRENGAGPSRLRRQLAMVRRCNDMSGGRTDTAGAPSCQRTMRGRG